MSGPVNYILIDAKTRAPVPLPCDRIDPVYNESVRITGVVEYDDVIFDTYTPRVILQAAASRFGLALITEAEFMEERSCDE